MVAASVADRAHRSGGDRADRCRRAFAAANRADASDHRRPPPRPRAAPLFRRAADPPRPLRVLVVGDSVGLTFGRGVELWAREHGNAVVENAARIYCPLGRDLPIREGVVSVDSPRACNWTEPWQSLVRTFDPDVTLVLFSIWEGAPRRCRIVRRGNSPATPALDAWQLAEYKAAAGTLSARGGHVVWMTVPCDKDVAINKKSGLWYVNRRTIPRLSDASSRVHVLDLDAKVCPGGKFTAEIDGVHDARPDGTHFSDAGALAVANWAMPIVRRAGTRTRVPPRGRAIVSSRTRHCPGSRGRSGSPPRCP